MQQPAPKNSEYQLSQTVFLLSKTDTKGIIKYGNPALFQASGYSERELLGANHNIFRHADVPRCIFKMMWNTLEVKQDFQAYLKNVRKDGAYYWTFADITPTLDVDQRITGFFAVQRAPKPESIRVISEFYKQLRSEEERIESGQSANKQAAMDASQALLHSILHEKGLSYEEYIIGF